MSYTGESDCVWHKCILRGVCGHWQTSCYSSSLSCRSEQKDSNKQKRKNWEKNTKKNNLSFFVFFLQVYRQVYSTWLVFIYKSESHTSDPGWHCVGRVRNKWRQARHQKKDPGGCDSPPIRRGDFEERFGSGHPEIPDLAHIWSSHPNLTKVAKSLK